MEKVHLAVNLLECGPSIGQRSTRFSWLVVEGKEHSFDHAASAVCDSGGLTRQRVFAQERENFIGRTWPVIHRCVAKRSSFLNQMVIATT